MQVISFIPKLSGFVIIGLIMASCSGGTSRNTGNSASSPTSPQSLTVMVPSLNYTGTVNRNTPISEINDARRQGESECRETYAPLTAELRTCLAEVTSAYNQGVNFINP